MAASYLVEKSSKECGAAHLDAKEELLLTFNTICLNVQSFWGFKTVAGKIDSEPILFWF